MQKFIATVLTFFILMQSFAQAQHKQSLYLQSQFNKTIYDRTIGNNPWGIGVGIQLLLNNTHRLKPVIELTADTYLEDDKLLRLNNDGTYADGVESMVNAFTGLSYQLNQSLYFSFSGGLSFINGETLLGLKPSAGISLNNNQRWIASISYINIFNRDKISKEDFGSISLSVEMRLF